MKLSLRTPGNAVILDLYGDWPTSDDELAQLRQEMNQMLEHHSGPLIYYIHDAAVMGSVHLGLLFRVATKDKGVARELFPFTVVSPHEQIRDVFLIVDGPIRACATEEEALRKLGNNRNWRKGLGNAV